MSTEFTFFPHKIDSAFNNPSLTLNHTCLRIKDPNKTLPFYMNHFGMKLLRHQKFPNMKFDLYFLSFPKENLAVNEDGSIDVFRESGILELTHNYGTENDPEYKINNGNVDPFRGFGHICFTVPDLEKECQRLETESVKFQKKLSDGRQNNIAFILDPDGYWIELVQHNHLEHSGISSALFNHTMVRVKDPVKSLEFYQNIMGMSILHIIEHADAKFTLYFLGYNHSQSIWDKEGVLELTHNWGTENDSNFKYHTGNEYPQGYGHICFSMEDPFRFCKEIEDKYLNFNWGVKYDQGSMKNLAFIKDPDGYSIEIVPHGLKL